MALNSYFKKFKSGSALMDGRDKGAISDLCTDTPVHVDGFDFLQGDDGEYTVFTVAEDANNFYYGNSIVTEVFKQIKEDEMSDELAKTNAVFKMKKSKIGRDYVAIDFVD